MGEIAEMMLDGTLDFYTGEYLGKAKRYPRTAKKELPWEKQPRKSEDLSWKRVTGYMNFIGIKGHLHPEVIKSYGVPYTGKSPLRNACLEILKDWERFKIFVKQYGK